MQRQAISCCCAHKRTSNCKALLSSSIVSSLSVISKRWYTSSQVHKQCSSPFGEQYIELILKDKYHHEHNKSHHKEAGSYELKNSYCFANHLLDQSNGEAFLYIFKQRPNVEYSVEEFLSNYFHVIPSNEVVKYATIIENEHELLDLLIEMALFGGAFCERPENSLAKQWATTTIDAWKSQLRLQQVMNLHTNHSSDCNQTVELTHAASIDLYDFDSSFDFRKCNSRYTSLYEWLKINQPFKEIKYFFNGTMWDKLLLCEFKVASCKYYILMGITDKA